MRRLRHLSVVPYPPCGECSQNEAEAERRRRKALRLVPGECDGPAPAASIETAMSPWIARRRLEEVAIRAALRGLMRHLSLPPAP
jgi:hypothetical protein